MHLVILSHCQCSFNDFDQIKANFSIISFQKVTLQTLV